jgi:SAM-dependent methyltransferase
VAGTGGAVAPDGSPVELYLLLPSYGEPEIVHGAIPDGASILELGCGAGRMTHPLVGLGHPVTAVDESPEMLAQVRGATKVLSRIEELELRHRFDCVLLASHFVNAADHEHRRRLLDVCARHVDADGRILVETYPEDWHPEAGDVGGRADLEIRFLRADWDGPIVTAEIEYQVGERRWRQGPFTAAVLGEDTLVDSLEDAGLAFDGWLDEHRTWFAARWRG